MKRVRVCITGKVQGVGFRFFIKNHAERLHLDGFVENTSNGNVEAVFQGDKKAIDEKMIELCRKGPDLASVTNVHLTAEQIMKTYNSFTIQ